MKTDKLSIEIKEFLEKASTRSFLFAVRQFISLMETTPEHKKLFYYEMHSALLDLYTAGHNLETIDLKYSNADSHFEVTEISYPKNARLFSELGEDEFYSQVFDPRYSEQNGKPKRGWKINDKEVMGGSYLTGDFTEIYGDLKRELEIIDKIGTSEAVEDALWSLKFGFKNHWGNHSIDALRYLHYLFY